MVVHVGHGGVVFGIEVLVDALVATTIYTLEGVNTIPINVLNLRCWLIECVDHRVPHLAHAF